MKSQKGITLISLTIYIIVIVILVGMMSIVSRYFYSNVDDISNNVEPLTEYTKFSSYITDDINHDNIEVLECKTEDDGNSSYIVFNNGAQYTFLKRNKSIYRNKVKICRWVENCVFENSVKDGKNMVTILVKLENMETKNMQFILKN